MVTMKSKNNKDIRQMIKDSAVPQYEIARRCGVEEGTLCRWLRYELSADDERRHKIIEAIENGGQDNE